MLSLSEIENGHHGCLLVLWWIPFEDLINELIVLLCKLEGNLSVVFGSVAVLYFMMLVDLLI
jgi:hypothetical protein